MWHAVDEAVGGKHAASPFVLACSNCPWDLDAAFIRRFSRRIFIDVPTSEDTVKILKKQLGPDASFDENFWAQIQRISEG